MRQAALRGGCRLQDWLKSLLFVPAVGLSRLRNPTWGSKKVLFQLRVFQVFFWVGGFSLKSRRHRLLFYRVRALMPSKSAVTLHSQAASTPNPTPLNRNPSTLNPKPSPLNPNPSLDSERGNLKNFLALYIS